MLGQHPPLGEDPLELFGAVDWRDRRAVAHEVRIAVRKHDDITGHQSDRTAVVLDAGMAAPLGDEMENDHVLRRGGQIGRHGAAVRFPHAPGRGEFAVEKHGAVEFHGLEHFGQHVHREVHSAGPEPPLTRADARLNERAA